MLHRYWLNNLIDDSVERRYLLPLGALCVGLKVNELTPKMSELVQCFKQSLDEKSPPGPPSARPPAFQQTPSILPMFKSDPEITSAIVNIENEILLSNNFFLDISLPGVILDRFATVIHFPSTHKRRQAARDSLPLLLERHLPVLPLRVLPPERAVRHGRG